MLEQTDSAILASMLESIADVQLQLDASGVCVDVQVTNPELTDLMRLNWRGLEWHVLCGDEHRERAVQALKRAMDNPGEAVRVDIHHRLGEGEQDIPMSYRLVCPPSKEGIVAVGRDLRVVTDLRQQLLNAQHAMEQDYWALRQMENRYRRLLELTSDAVLVVDEATGRVLEANSQANSLLAAEGQSIIGKPVPLTSTEFDQLLQKARESGSAQISHITLPNRAESSEALVNFLRQGAESRFLIRLSTSEAANTGDTGLVDLYHTAPDGIVQVDSEARILSANPTFLDWLEVNSEEQVLGRTLDNWIGRSTVDVAVLLSNLRQGKSIKLYASILKNSVGVTSDVEISAAAVTRNDGTKIIFFIRDISRRLTSDHPLTERLPRSIEQITERVGRLPLKELVRESTDVIEALCIEAALKLTRDNRASAAEILGLSRQSLYTKLRRYGIGETESGIDAA